MVAVPDSQHLSQNDVKKYIRQSRWGVADLTQPCSGVLLKPLGKPLIQATPAVSHMVARVLVLVLGR